MNIVFLWAGDTELVLRGKYRAFEVSSVLVFCLNVCDDLRASFK